MTGKKLIRVISSRLCALHMYAAKAQINKEKPQDFFAIEVTSVVILFHLSARILENVLLIRLCFSDYTQCI